MTRLVVRRRPLWALALAVLIAAALGGYSASLLVSDQAEHERDNELLCEAVNANSASLRNLLVSARNQTPRLTRRAKRFYREQIAAVQPLDCSNFDRDSLRRRQERAEQEARGGDASTRAQPQPP